MARYVGPGNGGAPPFVVEGTPAGGKFIGYDTVNAEPQWQFINAFAINSFAKVGGTIALLGAAVANPTFNASYNRPATGVVLTDTEGHTDTIALPGTAFVSPHTFTKTVFGQSVTFTDTATDGTGSSAANATITWGAANYFGAVVDPGVYNSAFVNSLSASAALLNEAGSYAFNAGAGQSSFFACRTAYGVTTANFTVNGFPFACSKVATVAVTNPNGVVENYDVFRSDNVALGAFTLAVS